MSRHLQKFVDNFMMGLQVGWRHQDRLEAIKARKEATEASREAARMRYQMHGERMGIDRMKAEAYAEQARAAAKHLLAKAGAVGAKGAGGPAGPSPGASKFLDLTGGPTVEAPPEQQPAQTVAPAEPAPVLNDPPATSSEPSPDVMARGGKARAQGIYNTVTGIAGRSQRMFDRSAGTTGPGSGYGDTAAPPSLPTTQPGAIQTNYLPPPVARNGGRIAVPVSRRPDPRGIQRGPASYDESSRWLWQAPEEDRYRAEPQREDDGRPLKMAGGGSVQRFQQGGSPQYDLSPDAVYGPQDKPIQMVGPDGRPVTPGFWDRLLPDRDWAARQGVPTEHQSQTRRIGNVDAKVGTRHVPRSQYGTQVGPAGGADVDPSAPRDWRPPAEAPAEGEGTGPPAEPEIQQMPGITVTGNRPRGGAIDTRWKPLRDQTREKAFDYEKDLHDPDNVHYTDPTGRVNTPMGPPAPTGKQGTQTAGRGWTPPTEPQGGVGMNAAGTAPGMATNRAADDYQAGAARYASAVTGNSDQGKAQLYSGAGTPDMRTMEGVFKAVDPEGKLPISERMRLASETAYNWYAGNGDQKGADRAAAEIAQYGVTQSRSHGVNATKLLQSGDIQGAVQQLIQGYDWLPNGQKATVQGNQILIVGRDGRPVMNIPMNPQVIGNLAMGMASGKLGWDVMEASGGPQQPAGGQPPPAGPGRQPWDERQSRGPTVPISRPAAQPTAAPAGPAQTPAAPPPVQTAQAPATPAPPAPARPAPAPAGPTAIATTPPTAAPQKPSAAAPAPAPSTTPPASTQSTSAGAATPSQGDKTAKDDPVAKEEQEWRDHFAKNGYAAPRSGIMRTTAQDPKDIAQIDSAILRNEQEYHKEAQRYMALGNQYLSKKEQPYLTKKLAELKLAHDTRRRELIDQKKQFTEQQFKQDLHDQQTSTAPRSPLSLADEERLAQRTGTHMDAQVKGAKDNPAMAENVKNSVLRYAKTPDQRGPISQLAYQIWQQNKGGITLEKATEYALGVTSIVPTGEAKEGNYGKGKEALTFRPLAGNTRRGYVLRLPSGERIMVDHNTYQNILQTHRQNWKQYEGSKGKSDFDAAEVKRRGKDLAKRAIDVVVPNIPVSPQDLIKKGGQLIKGAVGG